MHIIGTAGHIDHGKTALIEALTGINADRLPEEKKRGMTIDLGFAHFEGAGGEPVGVIDVPGHERFIRNMVAGAWSLSCAVLVVAGDEGWMPQTEDHARVLEAMGIRHIVCALTKIDITEKELLSYVTETVQDHLTRIFQKKIVIIPVSSVTGEGIDTLRGHLIDLLGKLPNRESNGPGFIHIDRVFTIKGSGTVITGSLSGGKISEGDEVTILPRGLKTKIRGIQSYHSAIRTARSVSRVACNLQGIKKEEISRGCIAAADPGAFYTEDEFIIQFEELDKNQKTIKNHMELEIACGTGHYIGIIHFLRTPGFARIVLNEKISAAWFDHFLLIRQGGHHILGKGRFIWAGATDRHFRIRLSSVLAQYPVPEAIREEAVLRFVLNGWYATTSDADRSAVESFAAAAKLEVRDAGGAVILEERYRRELQQLFDLAAKAGSVSRAAYLQSGDLPPSLKESLIADALKLKKIAQKDQLLISPEQLEQEAPLTPLARRLLDTLSTYTQNGLQLKDVHDPGAKKELRNLTRLGKVVALEGDIYYSAENFKALADRILEGLPSGSSFSIPEAKERTGLSRRYMIPLLNRMEEEGMVRRDGDSRTVC
ncbi:MAG: selenocysteine-specific translation elongation factor [Spirochaetota bacterium]|nr:selenocysteine-specific translation elongation factor [Spirochaetota bacterium]